jgi:hypothetical protein
MKQKYGTFYCFSPFVMAFSFALEATLFLYVLLRYKASIVKRLALLLLASLAFFQFAEYSVCTSALATHATWSRLGFVAITMLPPLGIHLAYALAGRRANRVVGFAYATSALWAGTFLFSPGVFRGYECTGNYVIFQLQQSLTILYPLYYYGWLLIGIILAVKLRKGAKPKIRRALWWQILGYSVFIVPTSAMYLIDPSTSSGIPSIMCGFAVVFAIILASKIMESQKIAKIIDWRGFIGN